ncbi:hypothetical protein V6N11_072015 [Hibiscus sabdariffa]|uniref:Uncharacterized protein n=1 Tax=Hibiscus sabdariffa TaxID=183260 RepID=A0ABR2U1S2_9ROSI
MVSDGGCGVEVKMGEVLEGYARIVMKVEQDGVFGGHLGRTNLTSANRLSKTINEENATLLRGQIGSGRHDTSKNAVRAGTAKPFKCLRFPRSEMETNISSYQQTMVAS